PVCFAAAPTVVKRAIARTLPEPCQCRAGPNQGHGRWRSPPWGARPPLLERYAVRRDVSVSGPCRMCDFRPRRRKGSAPAPPLRLGGAGAAVGVLEPYDIVELRR